MDDLKEHSKIIEKKAGILVFLCDGRQACGKRFVSV